MALSPRATPLPQHSLPPDEHAAARRHIAPRLPPISLLHYFLPLTVHYCSFWRRVEERARSRHDKAGTGVSCPYVAEEPKSRGSRAGRDEFRPSLRLESQRTGLKTGHYTRESRMPTLYDAWKLLCEYTASESLRKHMLAVEACVRAYARKSGADEEAWGLAALLHDFDYERWPNQEHSPDQGHPSEGAKILREQGYSEEIVRAIITHADYCGVPRQTALEHTLFACDEIAGFLTACAYVRPSKSILDLEVDSVKRRMKDKLFAKGVSREDMRKGAEELGVPLEEHIAFCIAALREHAETLGLRGSL